MALKYQVAGCEDTNAPGFDGTSYTKRWPDGSSTKPTPILISSPKTGPGFSTTLSQFAFEADLPRIEASSLGGHCNRTTGAGCTNPPPTDDGAPATFCPYYSQAGTSANCRWGIGSTLPGTTNNFGGSSQEFGLLYKLTYWVFGGHGATLQRFNDFNSAVTANGGFTPAPNNC